MHISFTFKNIDSSDSLKSYVREKLEKLDKMLDRPAEADVVLSVEKLRHIAEVNFNCGGLKLHMKEESESLYSSIDSLSDKMKLRIKKDKEKNSGHLAGNKKSIKDTSAEVDSEGNPVDNVIDL
ncbi:MAG: ribosome hibernation-promoting factor, HPF/YfiA family [Thermodesulfobacteriota bacterium]